MSWTLLRFNDVLVDLLRLLVWKGFRYIGLELRKRTWTARVATGLSICGGNDNDLMQFWARMQLLVRHSC